MPSKRRTGTRRARTTSDLMLAPAVIAFRLPLLAAEAADPAHWGGETTRAFTEKASAFAEGAVAAQMSLMASMWSFWPDVAQGKMPALASGTALREAADAAMKPVNRRIRANFRRLSRG